jgi:hypothetical protein
VIFCCILFSSIMVDEVLVVDTSSKAASIGHIELAFKRERKKERLRLAAKAQKKICRRLGLVKRRARSRQKRR